MKQNYAEYHFQNRDSEISDTEHSALWSNGLSVLSKLVADAADSSCYCPVYETEKERIDQRTKKETELSVKDALNALSVAVQAGYSVENAVAACSRDLERLYPKETDIVKEFHYIETQLRVSVPVEELLLSLGDRSGIEDVENFAAVFYTAKRTGGDYESDHTDFCADAWRQDRCS